MHRLESSHSDLRSFPRHAHDETSYLADHQLLYKELIGIIARSGASKILDIGAGTGLLYSLLPDKAAYELCAVDIVDDFVSLMSKRGIKAVKCDVEREPLPFPAGSFDAVVFTGMLEHTLKPTWVVGEIARVLKKDGVLILSTPNALSLSRRWSLFRGRNPFWPLIDNITSGRGYLRRCSVFYSEPEIRHILNGLFVIKESDHVNEDFYRNRKSSIIMKLLSAVSRFVPSFQEIIIVTAIKK